MKNMYLVVALCIFSLLGAEEISIPQLPIDLKNVLNEYEYSIQTAYHKYDIACQMAEGKIAKAFELKMKSMAANGNLDAAFLLKTELEKIKNGERQHAVVATFLARREKDLLGNVVSGQNDNDYSGLIGKWSGNKEIRSDGTATVGELSGTWEVVGKKFIIKWSRPGCTNTIDLPVRKNTDVVTLVTEKGTIVSMSRVYPKLK